MAAPLVGRRVIIENLASRPELNGTAGIAISFDDARGRYNVRLESNGGGMMALKPTSLKAADEGAGGTGGVPNFGGMPGFGGGTPGMAGFGRGGAAAALLPLLQRLMGGQGIPPGAMRYLGIAAFVLFVVLPRLGIGFMPALLLGGAGFYVYQSAARHGGGRAGIVAAGREVCQQVGTVVGRATGRAVSNAQAAMLVVAAAFLAYRYLFASGGATLAGGESEPSYAAYSKGFRDGQAGNRYAPISDAPQGVPAASAGGSKWGIGSLLNLAMAGSMIFQLGQEPGGGWSVQALMANARHANPMQLIMLVSILSGFLS